MLTPDCVGFCFRETLHNRGFTVSFVPTKVKTTKSEFATVDTLSGSKSESET